MEKHSTVSTARHRMLFVVLAALVLLVTACGSAEDDEVASLDGEVATLVDTEGAADAAVRPDEDAPETDPEEAALAFSQCMRDEGVDFPDLGVDAEGNIQLREGFQAIDRRDESVRSALEACQPELAAGGFGGGRRAALQSTEVQDALVEYADCIREQGFDVGDLQLGQGPGQGAGGGQGAGAGAGTGDAQNADQTQDGTGDGDGDNAGQGGGQGPAAGQREGGFGNRNDRLARLLGLDLDDPAVEEALETCAPVLDEAFASAGIGQGRQGN